MLLSSQQMNSLRKFISFFNLSARYVADHFHDRCIVEYRAAHDILYRRSLYLKALTLNEQVLNKMIDGTINQDFDKHDVELIEAYNDIEEFCGDKNWGYSYNELRELIQSAKNMDSLQTFELKLRRRMSDKELVEMKLDMKYNPKLDSMNVAGCEKILIVNHIDLYEMYCEYCDNEDYMNQQDFEQLINKCYQQGFVSESSVFWNILHMNVFSIEHFNRKVVENPSDETIKQSIRDAVETFPGELDFKNHVHIEDQKRWKPNHYTSLYIVRMKYNEASRRWEYVV